LADLTDDERIVERGLLLSRAFSKIDLFRIGRERKVPYFDEFSSAWKIEDEEEASFEIASMINDDDLKGIFRKRKPREWAVFRSSCYRLEDGKLSLNGFSKEVGSGIRRAQARYGKDSISVLKALVKAGGVGDIEGLKRKAKVKEARKILEELERLRLIVTSYKVDKYQEWRILEETLPLVEFELGIKRRMPTRTLKAPTRAVLPEGRVKKEAKAVDPISEEKKRIEKMSRELDEYLQELLKRRLDQTIRFGKEFDVGFLSGYLEEMFGEVLYFDSLLSITQQYGLADVDIVHEHGKTGRKTGWSLALFGDPGTGKSFSTRDMVLGKPDAKIGAHGLPGRNRYCGGMTPARFIRIGQAYTGKVFNFIVPEFNDFFKYKGMVEPLKIAMEQGQLKYETHSEIIGPYRFTSFFAVNYNVSVHGKGYQVTIQDPNFNAVEDRMLCRLHRLTKERFVEITKSQMKLALGAINLEKGAGKIRDHLTLVHAIETGHRFLEGRFPAKPVMITPEVFEIIGRARGAILEKIPQKVVKFSARLEDRALRFACAASLMDYFRSDLDYIPVSEEALKYAVQLYVEEASVRSKDVFSPEEILGKIFGD
jgi:hypothetical protein